MSQTFGLKNCCKKYDDDEDFDNDEGGSGGYAEKNFSKSCAERCMYSKYHSQCCCFVTMCSLPAVRVTKYSTNSCGCVTRR